MPLVVYHGERVWPYATTFEALVETPEALRPYQPQFQYYLSDFSYLSDETIRGEIWLRVNGRLRDPASSAGSPRQTKTPPKSG